MDNGFIAFVKENKRIWKIGLFILLGVVLIFFSSIVSETDREEKNTGSSSLGEYKESLEEDIAALCTGVEGVGKCRVFITFEHGGQSVYKGGEVVETKPPKVCGVTVVCKGGDSDRVKRELTNMLTALFGLSSNRVAVLKLNS